MKYLGYLALSIFTFAIGVGISAIRFSAELIACGPGNSSAVYLYRSSYFSETTFSSISYDSEEEASDAFSERLEEAIKVIDLSPKKNKKGVLIKQRAVALFHHEGNAEYYVEAFWRDANVLYFIRSRSYSHVKEFEKQKL